jgi:hypothetical protein
MDSKLRDLLQAALDRTRSGKLSWQAFGSESFRARVGSGSIHIQRAVIPDDDTPPATKYSVQVANALSQVVAEAEATEGRSEPNLPLLHNLFTAARTSGLGGYEVIDEMIRVLQIG